ncbi:MAG: response regulator, partial [Pseudomonadota bacterium]|nr:response regulator [Pseudomonadota bacterium]
EVGLLYLLKTDNPPCLHLVASYGYSRSDTMPTEFLLGEGLVGQAALDRRLITRSHRPEETVAVIQSSLAQVNPPHVIWTPFLYENEVAGVIELGLTTPLSEMQQELLQQLMPSIAIAINTAHSRDKMQHLLQQSQEQAEQLQQQTAELTAQQEQMQQVNEELQSQAEELQSQQEELRQTNDELETRTRDLEQQREAVRIKNQDLEKTQAEMERARAAIEQKAQELELASKYKSEFLANMSHELRTPLNSLLILAQLLAENKGGNLSEKQQEYARTIHSAGVDLLTLINEILDLSKVEAGKMDVSLETVRLQHLLDTIEPKFRHLAEEKQLTFEIEFQQPLPESVYTDPQRLKQIINNLLSNAFKFTSDGYVKLILRPATTEDDLSLLQLTVDNTLVISVIDSGVGIAKDKQQLIFEAFQQEDGTTSRRYGGTGLGLSISRQLARLLGGELQLHSELGQGSTFTLYLPQTLAGGVAKTTDSEVVIPKMPAETPSPNPAPIQEVPPQKQKEIIDDREHLGPDDKCLLIIEDDRKFIHILMELTREKGFKCLIAEDGKTGLQLAETYKPQAIILDISLPKVDGWTVMEKLKDNPDLRHIPVHFMSAGEHSLEARKMGAIGYLLKPVNMEQLGQAFKKIEQFTDRTVRKLLVLTDNAEHQQQIFELVGGDDIQATLAATQVEAYEQLQKNDFDCVIVDVEAEASTGVQFLQKLHQQDSQIPIILHATRDLTVEEEHFIHRYTDTLTVKAVQSPERLLDEATLFLHQIEANMPQKKREMLQMIHDKTALLMNKRVLVVDDDIRNTFALTTVLEDKDMEVFVANNGQEALTFLQQHPNMDIVLMDIMMPEMDGYEATKKIRAQAQFRKLPIIALTAKAMK